MSRGRGSGTRQSPMMRALGPADMITTRSASAIASSRSWVTNSTALRSAFHNSSSRLPMICRVWASSGPNGSSISRILGSRISTCARQVLIRDPKILLMDEPFGPLDAQTRQIMGNLLLELWNADRKAVLFVTHDLEEAIALADRVVIMSAGPSARIIGDWRVPLARPRDIFEVRLQKEFHSLHHEIWSVLKAEVLKGYAQSGGG